jgi:hypothetical protein
MALDETSFIKELFSANEALVRKVVREYSPKPLREPLWLLPDPLATGASAVRYFFSRPHLIVGAILSSATATTGTCEVRIEYTANGGATWAAVTTTNPTIASGKYGGGALVNFGLGANVGGAAGVIAPAIVNMPAGYGVRINVISTGGATGLTVQLLTEMPLQMIKQAVVR